MSDVATLRRYLAARDAMLAEPFDATRYMFFLKRWRLGLPSSAAVAEISFHKTRTAIAAIPMELRVESWRWLEARDYQPFDDGDVALAAMTEGLTS